ncbi:3-oxoacyl-[acyl-carrier-protein] synthase 2 [Campylobacterota bacterium]|nr:3-oxoacyl-[acyl-carrier-protein] synthase 2 [Campylobacterota bacterium]
MKRVVVTGLGAISALGHDAASTFDAIISGKCGVGRITLFDPSRLGVTIAAEVKEFDPASVMDQKEVKKADRFIHLGLKCAQEAMKDCGLGKPEGELSERFGVSAASGIGGLGRIEEQSLVCGEKGPKRISPFFIPSALANMLGGFVSIEHNLKGPNLACVTACAAGTHSICEAYKAIVIGEADIMLSISAEAAICEVGVGGFAAMRALSTRNDDPQHASRPFDRDRDGFIMGEGGGALILEEYEHAKKRGAKIYAELIGIGESGDANHITTPAPEGEGAYRAMKAALKMADANANGIKVGYVNAHGTSTVYNDWYETMAMKRVFNGAVPPASSTKGAIGHCLGGAGGVEAVISILSLNKGILPPTINFENRDTEHNLDLDYVPNTARDAKLEAVMSNSFGFGGTNGVVVFKKI